MEFMKSVEHTYNSIRSLVCYKTQLTADCNALTLKNSIVEKKYCSQPNASNAVNLSSLHCVHANWLILVQHAHTHTLTHRNSKFFMICACWAWAVVAHILFHFIWFLSLFIFICFFFFFFFFCVFILLVDWAERKNRLTSMLLCDKLCVLYRYH